MKKSTYRRYLRLTCTFLALTLLVLSIPLNTFAAIDNAEQNINDTTTDTTEKIVEVTERREENVKHFRKPDGTYTAVSYAGEVHRKDESGNWQDIDNSLSLNNTRNTSVYSTKDNRVSFSKTFEAGKQLFSLSEDDDLIAVSLLQKDLDANDKASASYSAKYLKVSASDVTNAPLRAASWDTVEQAAEVDTSSRILYENVKVGMDLEYILDGNDVKENIIIKHAQNDYSYDFQMVLVGLEATLCDDGSVIIRDAVGGEEKYTIPAPYMYDAEGEISYAASYTLTQIKSGMYVLNVSADKEWINSDERAFPVVIDPTIVKTDKFYDTYVNSSGTTNYGTSDNLIVSSSHTAFIKFDLPELPQGAQPNQIQLKLSYYFDTACTGQYIDLEIWRVDTFWRSGTLKSDANMNFTEYEDCIKRVNGHSGTASSSVNYSDFFDITAIARDWYNGVENEGIAFKRLSGSISQIRIKSYETSKAAQKPHLYVDYSNAFSDGIYMFINKGTYGMYMDTRDDSYKAGAYMQQTNLEIGEVADNGMKFKLTRVEETDSYIIRLMTNNCLTFSVQSSFVVTKEISPYDDEVLYGDTFYITYQEDGYVIQPYASSSKIAGNSGGGSGDNGGILATLSATTTLSNNAKWDILPCSIPTHETSGFIYVEDDKEIVAGEEVRFIPVISSTQIGYNVPEIVLDEESEEIAEYVSSTVTGKTRYNIHKNGEIKLYLIVSNGTDYLTYEKMETFDAILPFEEGKYAIQNRETGGYMFASNSSNSAIATGNFVSSEYQVWNIQHVTDDQYTIRLDAYNTYCLTAPSIPYDYVTMEEDLPTYAERQIWVWDSENDMFYSKIHESYAPCTLSVSTGSSDTRVYHSPYNNDDQSNDEWNFIQIELTVDLISQEKSMWCWVACANMFAQHYAEIDNTLNNTNLDCSQSDIVFALTNTYDNVGASPVRVKKAINSYLGLSTNDAVFYSNSYTDQCFSENTLKTVLEDGHVIICGTYPCDENTYMLTGNADGHYVIVAGYVTLNNGTFFILIDPWLELEYQLFLLPYRDIVVQKQSPSGNYKRWTDTIIASNEYQTVGHGIAFSEAYQQ